MSSVPAEGRGAWCIGEGVRRAASGSGRLCSELGACLRAEAGLVNGEVSSCCILTPLLLLLLLEAVDAGMRSNFLGLGFWSCSSGRTSSGGVSSSSTATLESNDSPAASLRESSGNPWHWCPFLVQVEQTGRSPAHLVFRRRQVKQAALILRRLDGGWPWLLTKRICRGCGGFESVLLGSEAMLR